MIAAHILTGRLPQTTGEVSAKFLKGARKALDIYRSWGLKANVDLSGFTPVQREPSGDRVATFFTLGVDSFYTLLTHLDEIDDLIYVEGFERQLSAAVVEEAKKRIELAAQTFEKKAVFLKSNIRETLDKHVHWYRYGAAPALASVGLANQQTYKRIYIAASDSLSNLQKCSSHPHIDPLWSTESLEFIHDAPITRIEKLKEIAKHPFALDHLRVCWQGADYNCSKCEKCVRTMVSLSLLGLSSSSFDTMPDLSHINAIGKKAVGTSSWAYWSQNIEEIEKLLRALKGHL